jgi:hypothetical protein
MIYSRRYWNSRLAIPFIVFGLALSGCTKSSDNPMNSGSGSSVTMALGFSNQASGISLGKTSGVLAIDSLRIDSANVVIDKIRLWRNIDSVAVDSTKADDDMDSDSTEVLMFKGPFVVHVRDSIAVDFASQVIPAGNYTGVSISIRRLMHGERHWDSDDFDGMQPVSSDSLMQTASVVVWGAVKKDSGWVSFMLPLDISTTFKIKGDFTVPEAVSSMRFALNFNMDLLFTNPYTGGFLDPTNPLDRWWIARALTTLFGHGHCGRQFGSHGHWHY